jgi:hypothetical protein
MRRVPAVKEKATFRARSSLKSAYRRGFSRGLALGLILLACVIVLSGGLLYSQGGVDALFIDEKGTVKVRDLEVAGAADIEKNLTVNGNVRIGTIDPKAKLDIKGATNQGGSLTVKGNISSTGMVDAQKFKGDGTSMTINDYGNIKEALDKKLDKRGGAITGSLKIDEEVSADGFNICYCLQCRQDKTTGPERCAKFGEWTEYSIPPKGNSRYESGCRIKLDIGICK